MAGESSQEHAAWAPPSAQNANGADASQLLTPLYTTQSVRTPGAESVDGYFPTLRTTPSAVSRISGLQRHVSGVGSEAGRPTRERRPSIRIRRISSNSLRPQASTSTLITESVPQNAGSAPNSAGRPRSISQPGSLPVYDDDNITAQARRVPHIALPRLTEEGSRPTMADLGVTDTPLSPTMSLPEHRFSGGPRPSSAGLVDTATGKLNRKQKLGRLLWPRLNTRQGGPQGITPSQQHSDEYDAELVDFLDTIDPEIQALSTLTNVQNSLFIPDLGSWLDRRPTYILSQHDTMRPPTRTETHPDEETTVGQEQPTPTSTRPPGTRQNSRLQRSDTITSKLTGSHYAALPHGISLDGWSDEEKRELDDHVRHMLHSRRSKFKRSMKGFGQYVRRPLGFFVTLYATLITLFGLAWVLFLIGWVYVGDKQIYTIHIIDSVLVALFAIMGDGLIPFRIMDTYHLIFIVHYSRIIEKAQKKKAKEEAQSESRRLSNVSQADSPPNNPGGDGNTATENQSNADNGQEPSEVADAGANETGDTPIGEASFDIEQAKSNVEVDEDSPLTIAQQKKLSHHQTKLSKSHSFYKPDETFTHNPFPLGYLMAIVILLDFHSCLQVSLGACTWGINYRHRPIYITTIILCLSITCNLTAGLVITIGDRKTRKKDVVKLLDRQALTEDAMKHLEVKRAKEQEKNPESGSAQKSERLEKVDE